MKRVVALSIAAGLLLGGLANAYPADTPWTRYRTRDPEARIYNLVVKRRCLSAEDSAGRLRLLTYDPRDGRAVYGCTDDLRAVYELRLLTAEVRKLTAALAALSAVSREGVRA
jgi:hypothetical protein